MVTDFWCDDKTKRKQARRASPKSPRFTAIVIHSIVPVGWLGKERERENIFWFSCDQSENREKESAKLQECLAKQKAAVECEHVLKDLSYLTEPARQKIKLPNDCWFRLNSGPMLLHYGRRLPRNFQEDLHKETLDVKSIVQGVMSLSSVTLAPNVQLGSGRRSWRTRPQRIHKP